MPIQVRLKSLQSFSQLEADGDEVFITIDNVRVFPLTSKFIFLKGKSYCDIDYFISLDDNSQITINLWEYNFLLPNKRLGQFTIKPTDPGGPYTAELIRHSAEFVRYQLVWEVFQTKLNNSNAR
jgi:hypothetical protein